MITPTKLLCILLALFALASCEKAFDQENEMQTQDAAGQGTLILRTAARLAGTTAAADNNGAIPLTYT